MNDPVFGKKFVPDMPVLMWDEHFNANEYRRLTRFKGIYGWRDVEHTGQLSWVHKKMFLKGYPLFAKNQNMFLQKRQEIKKIHLCLKH